MIIFRFYFVLQKLQPIQCDRHKMFIVCPKTGKITFIFRSQKSKSSYHKSISHLTKRENQCYNTPTLGWAAHRSQRQIQNFSHSILEVFLLWRTLLLRIWLSPCPLTARCWTRSAANQETFHTQILEVTNMTMKKNIMKTMQSIGEMAACIGNL